MPISEEIFVPSRGDQHVFEQAGKDEMKIATKERKEISDYVPFVPLCGS